MHVSLSHHSNVVAVALASVPVGVDVVDTGQQIPGEGVCKAPEVSTTFLSFLLFVLLSGDIVEVFKDILHPLESQRLQVTPLQCIHLVFFVHSVAAQDLPQPSLQLREFLITWALKECAAKIDGRGKPRHLPSILTQPFAAHSSIECDAARECRLHFY